MFHALLALLQTTPVAPVGLIQTLIFGALSVLLPSLAAFLAMKIAKLLPLIDNLPEFEKRLLVVVFGVVSSQIGGIFGVTLPAWLDGFDANTVLGLLDGAVAMLWYRIFKPAPTATKR